MSVAVIIVGERVASRLLRAACATLASAAIVCVAARDASAARGAIALGDEPGSSDEDPAAGGTGKGSGIASDDGDGSYGRIDGDVTLVVGAGVTVAGGGARAAADLRLRYIDMVGAFATYEDGALVGAGSEPRRLFATGLEVRPLFLARWFKGAQSGSAYADLFVDSLGLELGAVFAQPIGASFSARPGLQLGLGLEFPILARATGPWIGLHGGVRWSDAAMSTGASESAVDRAAYLSLTLAWHHVVGAHVVDANDRAVR